MGFEARQDRLPLQPRKIDSRQSALFPRETKYQELLPLIATEKLRTGNEGLFAAVRAELAQAKYSIETKPPQVESGQILTVAFAGSNNKKAETVLTHLTNYDVNVIRIKEAEEWHTKDPILDATSKATDAARVIEESDEDTRREVRTRPYITMATDQINSRPVITVDPITNMQTIAFERLGKPENATSEDPVQLVRHMFEKLATTATEHNWQTVPYLIELATVIHSPQDPENNAVSLRKSAVFLSVEGIKHLATDRFDEYVTRVKEQVAKVNGKKDVSHIAGGLELQVLEDMGIIEFISGTVKDVETKGFPPGQRPEAKRHAYELALGSADEKLIQDYFAQQKN